MEEFTTTKINSQEGGIFNFLRPLMTTGLWKMYYHH